MWNSLLSTSYGVIVHKLGHIKGGKNDIKRGFLLQNTSIQTDTKDKEEEEENDDDKERSPSVDIEEKSLLAEKAWCHLLTDVTQTTKQNQHLRKRKVAYWK